MQVKDFLKQFQQKISATETELILASVLKKDKVWLYQNPQYRLLPNQYSKAKRWACRRQKGEPLAYLLRRQEFYGINFFVNKDVLIPRPETETLVEAVQENLATIFQNAKTVTMADIGTGCGCISIAIAAKRPKIKIYATDISKRALKVAKVNAKHHHLLDKITFLHGDLLTPLPKKVDIIAANLPYVDTTFLRRSSRENCFEPRLALDGGENGLRLILKLLKQAPKYLKPDGIIFLEIAPGQKSTLRKFALKIFPKANIKIYKDLASLDRVILIRPRLT